MTHYFFLILHCPTQDSSLTVCLCHFLLLKKNKWCPADLEYHYEAGFECLFCRIAVMQKQQQQSIVYGRHSANALATAVKKETARCIMSLINTELKTELNAYQARVAYSSSCKPYSD